MSWEENGNIEMSATKAFGLICDTFWLFVWFSIILFKFSLVVKSVFLLVFWHLFTPWIKLWEKKKHCFLQLTWMWAVRTLFAMVPMKRRNWYKSWQLKCTQMAHMPAIFRPMCMWLARVMNWSHLVKSKSHTQPLSVCTKKRSSTLSGTIDVCQGSRL